MAEKKLLPKGVSELGVVICDLHQDSAVDWSDLSEVSIRNDLKEKEKKIMNFCLLYMLMIALTWISLNSNSEVSGFKVEIEINLSK